MFKYQLEDFQRWLGQHNALIVNLIENKLKPLQEEIEKIKEEMRMQSLYKRYIPSIHELIEMGFSQRP